MSFPAGVSKNPLIAVTDHDHEMVFLVCQKSLVHKDDEGNLTFDIFFEIAEGSRVLESLQASLFSRNNQIQVQSAPGAGAVDRPGDFLRRHRNPPVIQNPGQRRRSALIHFLGEEGNPVHKLLRPRIFKRGNPRAGAPED